MNAPMAGTRLADPIEMQNRLFGELSRMFGAEVPMYDRSLLVNAACNRAVADVLAIRFPGFAIDDAELERTSGERHGAIRIGRPDEYRWIARFFACFGMRPHNFYDMSSVGAKSQPIIATAFRSTIGPEHRVFTSLLLTDYFDAATKARIDAALADRSVFSEDAKTLVAASERDGGLSWSDAERLIREGVERIFKWAGRARERDLYDELCAGGFKIAADIACFDSHHLNHLTPNTLCMDVYTAAMRHAMGDIDRAEFSRRASDALAWLSAHADASYLRLHFKHLGWSEIEGFGAVVVTRDAVHGTVEALADRLVAEDLSMAKLPHNGFKDSTEGPSYDTPLLLRQDAYKALTEPVVFADADGGEAPSTHTARFGEIEQRFYATTTRGRALYDQCLAAAEAVKAQQPDLATRDYDAYVESYLSCFKAFPKTLRELLENGLVFGRYEPTPAGLAAAGTLDTADLWTLVDRGIIRYDGLRYEDFLPVSAAGIFASNLNQYGTSFTAETKPDYTRADLEEIIGKPIVDAGDVYAGIEAASLVDAFERLDVSDMVENASELADRVAKAESEAGATFARWATAHA